VLRGECMEELLKLAKKEKLDELESAWLEAVAGEQIDLAAMLAVPEVLVERGHTATAETLVWYLASTLKERGDAEGALRAARQGGMLLPRGQMLREILAHLYADKWHEHPNAETLVRLALESCPGLDEGIVCLERLFQLEPGSYVLDPSRNEVGQVAGFDEEGGGLAVEFAESARTYAPAMTGRLEPLSEDDFRALCVFEKERLRDLAKRDPEELVSLLLSSVDRRMELRRVRLYLEPVLGSWSRWWSGARDKLRRSAAIGMTEGGAPSLFLRRRPLTHEQRLLKRFLSLDDPLVRMSTALRILEEVRGRVEGAEEVVHQVVEGLAATAHAAADDGPSLALPAAAVLSAYRDEFPDLDVREVLLPGKVLHAAVEPLVRADQRLLTCVMGFVGRLAPGTRTSLLVAMMPLLPRAGCERAARVLAESGERETLAQVAREILTQPDAHPGAVAWLWRECASKASEALPADVDPVSVLFKLLSTGAALMRDSRLEPQELKARVAEVRSTLFHRDGELLKQALAGAPPERLGTVRHMAERNPVLTSGMQVRIAAILSRLAPSLFVKELPPWKQDVIYTTREGIEKRRAELERLVHERLPALIREIGEAASFGDVSDNAEYQSAIQERSRLADLANRMQEELSRARVITPEIASADHVTVGSRVRARNLATGEEEAFTFLGPWDADPEERIYAYNAPLGAAFMGRHVGDEVTFRLGLEERSWEVLEARAGV